MKGTKRFAQNIKSKVVDFLNKELKIQLNQEKIRITSMTKEKAHFLGMEIFKREECAFLPSFANEAKANNRIVMYASIKKLIDKLISQNYAHPDKKPKAITKWIYLKPEEIIMKYNAVIRGVHNYYYHVENKNMLSFFNRIMLFSAAFTLARKLNISPAKVFKKYGKRLTIEYGPNKDKSISLSIPSTAR